MKRNSVKKNKSAQPVKLSELTEALRKALNTPPMKSPKPRRPKQA